MPRGRINQEKADFISWHISQVPNPAGKPHAQARRYYDGLYYRTDAIIRAQAAQRWTNAQAAPPAAPPPAPAALPPHAGPPAQPPATGPAGPPAVGPANTNPQADPSSDRSQGSQDTDNGDKGDESNKPSRNGPERPGASSEDEVEDNGVKRPPGAGEGPAATKHPRLGIMHSFGSPVLGASRQFDTVTEMHANIRDHNIQFTYLHPPFEHGTWEKGWETPGDYLDCGADGTVWVHRKWINGKVEDRLVLKDVLVPLERWTSFVHWHGDVRDLEGRLPMEIHCLNDIASVGGSKNCLHIRAHEQYPERMAYRMYACFCAHKDLFELIIKDPEGHFINDIPEPAIWSIFNDVVNACLVLQYGAVDESDAVPGWMPIVHRDIKDGNFFLDTREPEAIAFPGYPRARLADFGHAIRTDDDDPHNPLAYRSGGTEGWLPIEQLWLKSHRTYYPLQGEKMGEKTNVWGVGATIMRLMSRDSQPVGPDYFLPQAGIPYQVDVPNWANNGNDPAVYSGELRQLVESCVAFAPGDRPTLRDLQRQILTFTTPGSDNDRARGLRDGSRAVAESERLHFSKEEEKYKLGLAGNRAFGVWDSEDDSGDDGSD